MSARFALACGALAAAVLAASSGLNAVNGRTIALLNGPEPSRPAAASPEDCNLQNLRASLRPQGPLPAPGQMPAGSTMARIAQRGYLIAGINQDVQVFAFRDASLRLQGFDIDIVRDIAQAIFGDRERVVFRQLSIADRITIAKSGEVDVVVATTVITCERRREVDFSTAFLDTGQRVLVNRSSGFTGLASLRGHPVCASHGSTPMKTIQAAIPPVIPVGTSTVTDCLALLQLGKVDAVCATEATLTSMVTQDPETEIVGPRLTEESFGIAINKGTPDLVRFVNAVLERRVQDGRWQASYQRWLTPLLGPPPSPPTPQYQD